MEKDNELSRLTKLRDSCELCQGKGYIAETNDNQIKFSDCSCVVKIGKQLDLIKANIPKMYWNWDFRMLTNEFKTQNQEQYLYLKDYLENLKSNITNGVGFWLASSPGLAKSSIIAYFLRSVVAADYKAYFTRASHIISKKFEALGDDDARAFIRDIIDTVDVLAIEEIEKVHLGGENSMQDYLFFEFLSDIYDSNKVLFLSSNKPRSQVLAAFPTFISDRLAQLDYLVFKGESSGRRLDFSNNG